MNSEFLPAELIKEVSCSQDIDLSSSLPEQPTGKSNMNTTGLREHVNNNRRQFLGLAAMSLAAAKFGFIDSANAQNSQSSAAAEAAIKPGTNTSFASLKQIDAGLLNVGYAEAGPSDGPVVILLHGWPYDIHSYVDVAPLLSSAGYRVIVPYLRGYGTTRFLSEATVRNGQQSVIAVDVIALMDALKIKTRHHWRL